MDGFGKEIANISNSWVAIFAGPVHYLVTAPDEVNGIEITDETSNKGVQI